MQATGAKITWNCPSTSRIEPRKKTGEDPYFSWNSWSFKMDPYFYMVYEIISGITR